MLLEKLHAMTYAMQHGTYEEFENARTELTIACREADEKLESAQHSVQSTLLTDLKNNCVPVNGVHAPFCTGHESQSG
ncbi:hypothetical protein MASR2M66_11480 [Chloroflexota bacterium]